MATFSISVDDMLKTQVETICDDVGISLPAAAAFYSIENQTRLLQAKERMEQTGGTVHDLLDTGEDDQGLG